MTIEWSKPSYSMIAKQWQLRGNCIVDGKAYKIHVHLKSTDQVERIKGLSFEILQHYDYQSNEGIIVEILEPRGARNEPTRYSRRDEFGQNAPFIAPIAKKAAETLSPLSSASAPAAPRPLPARPAHPAPVSRSPLSSAARPAKSKLLELAEKWAKSDVKQGLEILATSFEIQDVPGDGHCLFWAFAEGLKRQIRDLPQEEFGKFVENASPWIFNNPFLNYELIQTFLSSPESRSTLETIQFLRTLACDFNKMNPTEVLRAETNLNQYLSDMANLSLKKIGGEPELHALSKVFNVTIQVLDAQAFGKDQERLGELKTQYLIDGAPTIYLLYTPGHYRLAWPTS